MRTFGRHSILVRSAVMLLGSFFLAGAVTISISLAFTSARQHQAATDRLNRLLDTVESTVRIACFVQDEKLADEVAQGLLKNKEVQSVTISSEDGRARRLLSDSRHGLITSGLRLAREVRSPFNAEKVIGRIQVDANTTAIADDIHDEVRFITLEIIGQLVLIALTVVAVMLVFIVRPIKAMSDGLHRMDATKGERLAVPRNHANSEIGRLVHDINGLAGNLVDTLDQERTLRLDKEVEEKKYHSIFENAETGIFIVDQAENLPSWNPAFALLLGIPTNEVYQGTLNIRQLPWENASRIVEMALNCRLDNIGLSDDLAIRLRNGSRRWLSVVLTPVGEDLLQGVVHDVTEHKEAEASARRLSVTDALTGMANRLGLEEELQAMLRDPLIAQTGGFALVLADLDNFRRINEGFGLPTGDAILRGAATRLGRCVKGSDTLARLTDDRFALILQSVTGSEEAGRIAERILASIRKPFPVDDAQIQIHASLGITLYPKDGADIPGLLRNAELALDRAKTMGGNGFVFFDPALTEAAEQRRHQENDLRQAIQNREFRLYFQPIVDLADNRLAGAEALIRWLQPEQGLIPPDAFIPLAEKIGLIDEIGLWVLDAACAQLAGWQAQGLDRYLSVNISAHQIPDGLPPAALADAVRRHGVDPARMALEITEGVLLADVNKALTWIEAAHGLGFRIYLDDFGTGYSSLSYLKRFPVDTIKVDKSFVGDMGEDGGDRTLVEAVVAMARSLGMSVVAEGVETAGQLDLLRAMNCRYGQGYYFSRPVPAEQFEAAAVRIDKMLAGRVEAPA
ncbi:MAG: EAL domain-containing protein [Gallionellaceae bacterium]|nr:EAL domain-containing protein [Gallionellaceae bacterium]